MINLLNKQTENKNLLAKTGNSSNTKNELNIIRVNSIQQKSLINQLKKLNLFYKLILILNKKIEKFPYNKINDKMINSRISGPNQNIIFNFNQKNIINDRRLKNTILGSNSVANNNKQAKATNSMNLNNTNNIFSIKGKYAIGTKLNIINNVEKILTNFFKYMFTLISKPQFINKHNKLIIRIFYYQNILSKDSLNSNTKLNKLYNLFNGTALAKAHYNSPKNQNSNVILDNLLALNKWNKIALSLQNNRGVNSVNDSIISHNENEGDKESARELANITKKVWINYIRNLFYNSYMLKQSKNNISISSVLPKNSNIILNKNQDHIKKIILNSLPLPKPALAQTGRVYASGHNRGIIKYKKYKNLLIKLIIATNSESLIKRRINLSKTYYNKSLLVKLTKKINNNNNNFILNNNNNFILNNNNNLRSAAKIKNGLILPYEFKGKGILLQPIYKTKMNNLIGGAAKCCGLTLIRLLKLSNSGNPLKLLWPNYNWKIISGWINTSGKVILQKMNENEMGNRGTKSVSYLNTVNTVKAQRVDGSWLLKNNLRCTLMGFERNYQIKYPSKQLNIKRFSTSNSITTSKKTKTNPWFITGFTDAEGSFMISILPDSKFSTNWRVRIIFKIELHLKDLPILENIKETLGVGSITSKGQFAVQYRVFSIKDLLVIINHFDKYPLVSAKRSDFILFKKCFQLLQEKEHLTEAGLLKIVGLKSSINLGLSDSLKEAFPTFVAVKRPDFKFTGILDPNWLSGFTNGDGSFSITIRKSALSKLGVQVQPNYSIGLKDREIDVLKGIANFLHLDSKVYIDSKNSMVRLSINKLSDIADVIIPFFEKHPIQGLKALDFEDFKQIAEIMIKKEHLSSEGLAKILKIREGMNQRRAF